MRDLVIIGGGQAGLATAYFAKRAGLDFVVLDASERPGGAWTHAWDSLTLFSPAAYSSLPGWAFPSKGAGYPTRDDVVAYLEAYEARYALPVVRPVRVERVARVDGGLVCETGAGTFEARAVVSCTGTWSKPYVPEVAGRESFRGVQVHSAHYRRPEDFRGMRVAVVGGGNSGAQILAEVSKVASTVWVTEREPTFLPDDVDGRVLFQVATQRYEAKKAGRSADAIPSLGDVVMVAAVKEARDRGVLQAVRPLASFEGFDAIIWCTGFRPSLDHLAPLRLSERKGRPVVEGTRSVDEPRLWLVGYGEWTGFGSATLIGVQRYAKRTVEEISACRGR